MRKIVIISTTFFPDPTVSAIRMTQWCRNLPKHGWQPHVLCRYYGSACSAEELAARVHPAVTLEYLDKPVPGDSAEASGIFGHGKSVLEQWLRAWLNKSSFAGWLVPDVSIFFWRQNREQILERVLAIQPDVILTTSPPHSNQDIGLWLAARTGIPWVADFRDPYLLDNRFRPRGLGLLRLRAHRRFKEAIYRRAWFITHAIPNQARWARRRYPSVASRMLTLTNGYPPELIDVLKESVGSKAKSRVVLVAGTIPEPEQLALATAVAQLAREGHDVQLKLLGRRPDSESALRQVLGDRLLLPGYVSHTDSIREVARADVLVNFLDDFRSQSRLLSTKLFEYLATGVPVVCVNPSQGDRLLLWRMTGVRMLKTPSISDVAVALRQALLGELRRDPAEVERFRAEFNWPLRASQLAGVLDRLVAFPPASVTARDSATTPVATVVISTRNRRYLLRQPILSALNQSVPVEVIVIDDGSTDETAEFVRREFPQVRLIRHEQSRGYIVRRNEAASLASANVIFSLDDDAIFSSPRVVEQTLAEFDHPRIGAVAIPFRDVRKNQTVWQLAPAGGGRFVSDTFIGTAHAVRRDVFLRLGGYREQLVHQGEEKDYCLRMMSQGWVVRLGAAEVINHYESPNRDFRRMDFYGRRNDVLFAWHNVPRLMLGVHLFATTFNGIAVGLRTRHVFRMLRGLLAGYLDCFRHWNERAPVPAPIYWLHRRLKKRGAALLEEIEAELPPLLQKSVG